MRLKAPQTHPSDFKSGAETQIAQPVGLWESWRSSDRVLRYAAWGVLALLPFSLVFALIDARVLDGSPVWHKPIKFQMSVGVYLLTLAMLVPWAGSRFRRGWVGRASVWTAVGTAVFEIVYITTMAGLGTRSHYNKDHLFGEIMYGVMGIAAVLLSLVPVVVVVAILCRRSDRPGFAVVRWGVAMGTAVTLMGALWVGNLLGPSPDHYPAYASDESARLPFVGWSTQSGDLRIAHFVGLHALQGMLLLSFFLARLPKRVAQAVLTLIAMGWLAVVVYLAHLALNDLVPWPLTWF